MIEWQRILFRCSAPAAQQEYFVFPHWAHHLHTVNIALRQVRRPWYEPPCEHEVSIIGRPRGYDVYASAITDPELNDHSCDADDAILRVAGMLTVCRRGRLKTLRFDDRDSSFRVKRRALRCDVLELAEHLMRAVAPVMSINEIEITYATNQELQTPQLEGRLRYLRAAREAIPSRDFYQIS